MSSRHNDIPSSPPFQSAQPRESLNEAADDEELLLGSGDNVSVHPNVESTRNAKVKAFAFRERLVEPSLPQTRRGSSPGYSASAWTRIGNPASTFRSHTAPERAIVASLDQLTAQDLSLHLYNAHALKERARLASLRPPMGNQDDQLWKPPKQWTAWPMPRKEVPRETKQIWGLIGDDAGSQKKSRALVGASHDLQELLIGIVLKEARERFMAEYAQRPKDDTSTSSLDSVSESERSSERASKSSQSPPRRSSRADAPTARPTKSQQPPRSKSRSLRPVIMADDSLATTILQPTIHHLLSRLDSLLLALHHSRQASLRANDDSQSENQPETEHDTQGAPSSADEGMRHSRAKGKMPRRRKPQIGTRSTAYKSEASDSSSDQLWQPPPSKRKLSRQRKSTARAQSMAMDSSELSANASKRRRRSSSGSKARLLERRQRKLGLRDWGEVLGVAAMVGWDREVIDKAASRCAKLFGQGIDFRMLGEGTVDEWSYLPSGIARRAEAGDVGEGVAGER